MHENGRRGIGVHLLDGGAHRLGQRGAGLDDHHHFVAALDRTLPPVNETMPGRILTQAHSRRSTSVAPGLLRLDNGWIGRIDEHRAFHTVLLRAVSAAPRRPTVQRPTRHAQAPPPPRFKHIAFVASDVPEAQRARRRLVKRYGDAQPETADVIVALGGDGLMLATLQRFMNSGKPIYGMHRGTVGFLMNEYSENGLRRAAGRRRSRPSSIRC